MGSNPVGGVLLFWWANSSVGRAPASHVGGHRFKSCFAHFLCLLFIFNIHTLLTFPIGFSYCGSPLSLRTSTGGVAIYRVQQLSLRGPERGRSNLSFSASLFSFAWFLGTGDCHVGTKSVPPRNDMVGVIARATEVARGNLSFGSLIPFRVVLGHQRLLRRPKCGLLAMTNRECTPRSDRG